MKETILLITDSEDYRTYLSLLLAPFFGFEDAPTLAHGLAKLRHRSYYYCAVLLDLSLPDSNWRTTFPAVSKSIDPAVLVLVSPQEDPGFVAQMIHWGAAGAVVKGKDDRSGPHLYTVICNAVRHERIQAGLADTTRLAKKIETELRAK